MNPLEEEIDTATKGAASGGGGVPALPEPPATLSPRVKLGLLLTAVLLAVGWFGTFDHMWHRWYPAWQKTHWSLSDRLTEGDSYYSHGPLVPLVSLIIVALIYRRVGAPVRRSRGASFCGWSLLALSLGVHLMSVYARVGFVSGFALVGTLAALLLLWGGWPLAVAYWLPVAFLTFMVPLPMSWIADLNFQLKFAAGRAALWLTNELFGVPAIMDGSHVHLTPEADGAPKTLIVENVCSGLRSLISLVCFASLFALICRVKGAWRWFMLAMAAPVAVGSNIVRITSLNVVAHHYGVAAAGPESWFHDFSGLAVFVVALALLFALEAVITRGGAWLKRDWTEPRLLSYLEAVRPWARGQPVALHGGVLVALAAAAAVSLFWAQTEPRMYRGRVAQQAVAQQVQLLGQNFVGQDLEMDEQTLTILETDDYLYRRFRAAPGAMPVDLVIVFSPDNRKGTHPPEVCLEGGGDRVVSKRVHSIELPRQTVRMRELVTQRGGNRALHVYVYKSGDSYTPDFLAQQARIFLNGLFNRNAAGALVRFTVPMHAHDEGAARELALAAARALMPEIDGGLP